MLILGISAFYHDSAIALLKDGQILFAAQEERYTRIKADSRFPVEAVRHCLNAVGVSLQEIDQIIFYEKPFIKFERLLETFLAFAPRGFWQFKRAMPLWVKEKIFQEKLIEDGLKEVDSSFKFSPQKPLLYSEHHLSHAASAYFASPFREALVLTMDGVGEWTTASVMIGRENKLTPLKEIHFPHSIGLLYSAFTYYTGFKVNSGEYKMMGLAPYGRPVHKNKILEHLLVLRDDGSFALKMEYFDFCTGSTMINSRFESLFGARARASDELLTQFHMDIAASIQEVTEVVILKIVQNLVEETGLRNLCLAGGVALNCVANGKIVAKKSVDALWVQPAAGDAGGALGAAYVAHFLHGNNPRQESRCDSMQGSYLGNEYSQKEIESRLTAIGARFRVLDENHILETCAEALSQGMALGWHQGRMEYGPRSLGARSILADPRSKTMQTNLNLKIKFRESFRPFAPAVLSEDVSEWFDLDSSSPYMLVVAPVKRSRIFEVRADEQDLFGIDRLKIPRSVIPSVTHVDYSARIQTVHSDTNPRFYKLISEFKRKTGCSLLVNTSFNIRGEPIVESPEDAFRCFMGTDLDCLAVGNCYLIKAEQSEELKKNYQDKFELD